MKPSVKTIILDRDNTLNEDPGYLNDAAKVKLLPGVTEGLRLLSHFGFYFHIATNQSGIARGLITTAQLNAVNKKLIQLLSDAGIKIESIQVCPHGDDANCDCRKPRPGLIRNIINKHKPDLRHTYVIGDRSRDIQAAAGWNIPGVQLTHADPPAPNAIAVADDFLSAARIILEYEFDQLWQTRLIARDGIAEFSKGLRSSGRVVFTNGVFDILHAGHYQYLQQASLLGDNLIVGINSDESVRKLKGPERPVNSEKDRALALLQLPSVSAVTIFPEPTPVQLLEIIRPHVHCKGGDYHADDLPETPLIREMGGQVIILPFRAGYSTSSIIARARNPVSR